MLQMHISVPACIPEVDRQTAVAYRSSPSALRYAPLKAHQLEKVASSV